MTARNLLRRHYDSYGGYDFDVDFDKQQQQHRMMMADDQPSNLRSTASSPQDLQQNKQEEETTTEEEDSSRWLQLGIGPSSSSPSTSSSSTSSATPAAASGPSVELELFSASRQSSLPRPSMTASPSNLGFRPPPPLHPQWGSWSSSSSMLPMPMVPQYYHYYNYNVQQRFPFAPPAAAEEVRVVAPPARRQQQAGMWFLLKAAENQAREPFLPQIPKSYIRIKDGRMTVRLVMKYLVNKLGLAAESEVEISCRGQRLLPFLALQHVRDNIWRLSEEVAFLSDSPSPNHVMTLQYGRSP